jgi:L-aspartate oxidase
MNQDVGVVRSGPGLAHAVERLHSLHAEAKSTTASDATATALSIARAALARTESRGAHFRSDALPQTAPPAHSLSRWDG